MKKNKKFAVLLILTPAIVFGVLCVGSLKVDAMENVAVYTYNDDQNNKCPCPKMGGGLLKESVSELKENGTLTEDDVKNIDSYMNKDREAKEAEIKEKIYNKECEKIDEMVKNKVITKEKGEKLKVAVKDNLQEMKQNMRKLNK